MYSEDINLYRQRAETERSRATDAPTPEIAEVHLKLASLYEDVIHKMGDPRQLHSDVWPLAHTSQPAQSNTQQ
jgi:hypothetical protein